MAHLVHRLFMLYVGLLWAVLWLVRALVILIKVGPRRFFYRGDPSKPPPSQLLDKELGEHAYINIGPVKLHYVVSGPAHAPLMLMLHGFPEVWYSWRHQIKEFQKDFRVVAVDMRGFGDSDKPEGVDNYRLDILVEDVHLFVKALEYKTCVLVAHDWGGAVAWAFAAAHPDMVDRLVVMNIPPVPVWRNGFTSITRPLQFLASGYIYAFQLPYLPETFMSLHDFHVLDQCFLEPPMGVRSGIMTQADVECYKYYFRKPGAMRSAINYYRANLGVPGVQHVLKYLMPVNVIWGCKDMALTLRMLKDIQFAVPEVEVSRLEEASHFVQLDQPEKVNQVVREFLLSSNYTPATR